MKQFILKIVLVALALSSRLVTSAEENTNSAASPPRPVPMPLTAADADTAFAAYNKAFYAVHGGKGYYKEDTTGGTNHFWTQAEEIEMILDTWERTHLPEHKVLISESINGFANHFGINWLNNKYNDDLLWMTIACARAFAVTGNPIHRDLAKFHFDETYARAWSTNLGGGLWWSTDNKSKNACVNGPGAIAACYLSQILKDKSYLKKAQAIYAWERKNLFDPTSGAIHDNMRANGTVGGPALTYNEGTFIGAANFLAKLTGNKTYLADAEKAADFTRDKLCSNGILPGYDGEDGPGFNGIFIRWLAQFAGEHSRWPKYHAWMLQNADTAWNNRRADNLAWNRWQTPPPEGKLHAWDCADTVVILQLVPLKMPSK